MRSISIVTLTCAFFATVFCSAIAQPATTQSSHRLQIRLVAENSDRNSADELPMLDEPNQKLHVLKHIELDERDLESAKPGDMPNNGGPSIEISFTDAGAEKFSSLTGNNIDRRLAIVFDGKILSAPTIRSRIGRKGMISFGSKTTWEEAKKLADTLNQMVDERGPATQPK